LMFPVFTMTVTGLEEQHVYDGGQPFGIQAIYIFPTF
jgi:hypothetical protein